MRILFLTGDYRLPVSVALYSIPLALRKYFLSMCIGAQNHRIPLRLPAWSMVSAITFGSWMKTITLPGAHSSYALCLVDSRCEFQEEANVF